MEKYIQKSVINKLILFVFFFLGFSTLLA